MSASQRAISTPGPSGGVAVFLCAVRLAIAGVVAGMGVVGLRAGLACHYDWAVIGASILLLAWGAGWLLSAGALAMRAAAGRLRRTADLVHSVALAAAALLFAGHSLTEQWWPFGWWPLVVGIVLAGVAIVHARDFARAA